MRKYIVGLSGGVDSCYALWSAWLRFQDGDEHKTAKIIAVSFSNGWDTEIAQNNARKICTKLQVKHETWSCDLDEFREIQRAFLLTGTPHAECPSDVGIKKTLLDAYDRYNAKAIITGGYPEEGAPLVDWSVVDGLYIKDVVKKHGRIKLKTFPNMTLWDHIRYRKKTWEILDDGAYNPKYAKEMLKNSFGWEDYGTKHYESIFTKWNQWLRYFKFGIDVRTLEKYHDYDLSKPPVPFEEFRELSDEVLEKLDLTFDTVWNVPKGNWRDYKSYRKYIEWIKKLLGK